MKSDEKQERRRALKALRKAQREHTLQLDKLTKARAHWAARTRELRMLEAEIASLTRRVYQPVDGDSRAETTAETPRRARVIFDVDAQDAKALKDIVKRLRAHGIIAEVDLKLSDAFVEEVAKEAVEGEDDLLIVAVDDATIERVALQLNNSLTALGIVPIEPSQPIAQRLQLPTDIAAACALIGTLPPQRMDIGQLLGRQQNVSGSVLVIAPASAL